MTPREMRRALRARRQELRRALPGLRRQASQRAEQLPGVRRERRRRRTRRALSATVLLLLLCLLRCDCGPEPAPPVPEILVEVEAPAQVTKPVVPAPARRRPLSLKTEPKPRTGYAGEVQAGPSWLDDFRLQVSARSGRLAQCFAGTERPGALRWSTSVNPENGAVSEHELEPVGQSVELGGEQRACVLLALSSPAYRLSEAQQQALPKRISLVIEF